MAFLICIGNFFIEVKFRKYGGWAETGCVEQQCAHCGLRYPNQGKHPCPYSILRKIKLIKIVDFLSKCSLTRANPDFLIKKACNQLWRVNLLDSTKCILGSMFRRMFRLPSTEKLDGTIQCTLWTPFNKAHMWGMLYLSSNFICFGSRVWGLSFSTSLFVILIFGPAPPKGGK